MVTTAIVFDHRGRAGKGEGPVEVRLTVDRRSYYVNTGQKCLRRDFRDGLVLNSPLGDAVNERIAIVRRKVEEIVNDMLSRSVPIDAAEIRRAVTGGARNGEERSNAFAEWCREQVELLNVGEGTRKHYATLIRRLEEFGRMTAWEHVTVENVCNWDAWLHRKGDGGRRISDAGVYNYHKRLKALLNRALLFGLIQNNPYNRLRGKFRRGEKESVEYLTEEEMAAFCRLRFEGGTLAAARDLFIFQMYTGMGYADTQRFDLSQYRLEGGRWVNVGKRVKTGVAYISELLPPVVEVLERNGWRVPRIDNSDYNRALKMLGEAAGIRTRLHSHLARHTFATFMLRRGSKIENVSRMLGHTNITQTQRYAKVLAQSVHDDFSRVRQEMEDGDTL